MNYNSWGTEILCDIWVELSNFFPKFGTWVALGSGKLKVRKTAKSVLDLWFDI